MNVVVACLSRCGRMAGLLLLAIATTATLVAAQAATPTIEGPVSGGTGHPFIAATGFDLDTAGYMQEEFFISGTATAYTSLAPLSSDGQWALMPA